MIAGSRVSRRARVALNALNQPTLSVDAVTCVTEDEITDDQFAHSRWLDATLAVATLALSERRHARGCRLRRVAAPACFVSGLLELPALTCVAVGARNVKANRPFHSSEVQMLGVIEIARKRTRPRRWWIAGGHRPTSDRIDTGVADLAELRRRGKKLLPVTAALVARRVIALAGCCGSTGDDVLRLMTVDACSLAVERMRKSPLDGGHSW